MYAAGIYTYSYIPVIIRRRQTEQEYDLGRSIECPFPIHNSVFSMYHHYSTSKELFWRGALQR